MDSTTHPLSLLATEAQACVTCTLNWNVELGPNSLSVVWTETLEGRNSWWYRWSQKGHVTSGIIMALCGPCARCVHYKSRSKKEKAFLFPVPENWLFFRNLDIPVQPPCEFIIAFLSLFLSWVGLFSVKHVVLNKAHFLSQMTFYLVFQIYHPWM